MKQPDSEVVRILAAAVRQYPGLQDWLTEWRDIEVTRLPQTLQNVAVAQGRCQVLQELVKLLEQSPEIAAHSR